MALPVANLTQASLEQLFGAFADDPTKVGMSKGVSLLNEMVGILNRLYAAQLSVDITMTDADDAGVSEFVTAEATISVGSIFRKTGAAGTEDLTDNTMATAKGGALVKGDVFVIDGADSVEFLGTQSDFSKPIRPFDFAGETDSDFIGL